MRDLISEHPALASILDEMLEVSGYLWKRGWAERNAGNLSVDVTEHIPESGRKRRSGAARELECAYPALANRCFLVTGSGRRFRDMAKDAPSNACILSMAEDGAGYRLIWGGNSSPDFRPTSEFPTHLRLHENLRENDAVERVILHTHPAELIALTHLPEYRDTVALNRVLWCIHPEVKVNLPKGVGFVPYELPGSEILAQATVKCFRQGHSVVLWEMHGCVAKAEQPMEAFDLVDIASKAASLVLMCHSVGHTPTGLSKERLDELVRTFRLKE
jgi:rhamnulose-1-phosphate aldolase